MIGEIVVLLVSTVLGAAIKLWGKAQEDKREDKRMTLQLIDRQAQIAKEAREYENKGFQVTRRIIALTITFFVVAFPMLITIYDPIMPITVGYTEFRPGFLFIQGKEVMVWKEITGGGILLTPMHTQLMAAVTGLYFGASTVSRR